MPGYVATDHFGFAASGWTIQGTPQVVETRERQMVLAADGDVQCESGEYNVTTEVSAEYTLCNGTYGVVSSLGTDLSAYPPLLTAGPGDDYLPTSLEFTLSNKALPSMSITAHQHASNPHDATSEASTRKFDVTNHIPDQDGTGITLSGANILSGDQIITVAATASIQSMTFAISYEHMDQEGSDGNHFEAENRTCQVQVTVSGIGTSSDITWGSDWIEEDNTDGDSGEESDTFTITRHANIDAT